MFLDGLIPERKNIKEEFDFDGLSEEYFMEAEEDETSSPSDEPTPAPDEDEDNYDLGDTQGEEEPADDPTPAPDDQPTEPPAEEPEEADEPTPAPDEGEDEGNDYVLPDAGNEETPTEEPTPAPDEGSGDAPTEPPADDEGDDDYDMGDTQPEEGGDDQPSEAPDDGGPTDLPDEGGDAGEDDYDMGDTSGGDEGGDGPTEPPAEGGDDNSSSGGGESSGDGSYSEEPDEPAKADKDMPNNLKQIEADMFERLSQKQKEIKIKELKGNYNALFDRCENILELLTDVSPSSNYLRRVFDYITSTITDLKQNLFDYLTNVFATKTFIENEIQLKRYITILNTVDRILDEVKMDEKK